MIVVKKFVFNPFMENTFIIWDEDTKNAIVIDPGCSSEDEEFILSSFIDERKLNIKYLINTHCHIDHILGCQFIKERYNPVYLAPEEDIPLLENAQQQAQMFGIKINPPPKPDEFLSEQSKISFSDTTVKLLFTPGHTPGEYCLYFEDEKFCIAGDVLFQSSIGRTDLWGGDYNVLINSIKKELLILPDDVIVYSGHGDETTIGEEKNNNPFLKDV